MPSICTLYEISRFLLRGVMDVALNRTTASIAATKQFTPLSSAAQEFPPRCNCDAGGRNATGQSYQEWTETRTRCLAVPLGGQRGLWETHLSQEGDRHGLSIPRGRFCPQGGHGVTQRNQHKCSPLVPTLNDRCGSVRPLRSPGTG